MRTLLLHDSAYDGDVAATLEAAGHEVVRCSPSPTHRFPCVGIDGPCPLDGTVDVAVVVHGGPAQAFDPGEAGVVCALRDGVPLVVVGSAARSPFGLLASAVGVGPADVDAACHRAVAARDHRLGRLVGGHVQIEGRCVRATLPVGATPADTVRAHRALGDAVPGAQVIDVTVSLGSA